MRRYIKVQELFDDHYNMIFGYVAIDVDTGKTHYFSTYDEFDNYNPKGIYPFDREKPREKVREHLRHCSYPFTKVSPEIPPDLICFIDDAFNYHYQYNEINDYPTNLLEFYKKKLKVISMPDCSLFGKKESSRYIPVENRMNLSCDNKNYDKAYKKEKEQNKSNIIHEIGHLKVTNYRLLNNRLYINIGFYPSIVKLSPIILSNRDIFYKIDKIPSERVYLEKRALEEIINDADCTLVYPGYMCGYPKIGTSLNKLCDNKLQEIRYVDEAFDVYCDYLRDVTGSKDIVQELNGLIKDTTYGNNPRKYGLKALKLIRQCQDRKRYNVTK